MLRVITMRYGNKFDQWYEDNFIHMINKYSNLKYDELIVYNKVDEIFKDAPNQLYNILTLFKEFRNGTNLVFDLDVVIKGDMNKFITDKFTMCDTKKWAKPQYYADGFTRSSDVMCWSGDRSDIYLDFVQDLKENYEKKWDGADPWLINYKPEVYDDNLYSSIRCIEDFSKHPIVFFNSHHETMKKKGWWKEYTI